MSNPRNIVRYSTSAALCGAFALVSIFSLAGDARGQSRYFQIDLGLTSQQTTVAGWNNLHGVSGARPTTVLNLIDTSGQPTGITMTPSWSAENLDEGISGPAADYAGPYPFFAVLPAPDPPSSAFRDGVYVRDGESLMLTLNNLPIRAGYGFTFYGAAGNTGDYSWFTVNGRNNEQASISPLVNNSSKTAHIGNIVPDSMHRIVIRFEGRRPEGSVELPSVNDDGLGRLNYIGFSQANFPAGDLDGDYSVNGADYGAWRANFGVQSDPADGNGNGLVDAADYVLWRHALAHPSSAGAEMSSSFIPEPSTFLLAAVGLPLLLRRRPR